jgi:hypothetical protein
MLRSGYKSLLIILFLLAGTVNLAAYYYHPDNQPPGPPPNYNPIDPGYFYGVPPLSELPPQDLTGYYVFYDSTESRWSILRMVPFGTPTYEQFHGSILVQLEGEPQAGVNVWPEGFDLTDDFHRNDRWGWVKWPDSIAPNLYEIWWDITLDCPEPSVPCTRTIGFWKNHSGMGPQDDLVTELLPIWLGTPDGPKSLLVADAETAAGILSWAFTPNNLDGISKLQAQLLAAKLSIASGADGTVIADVIDQSDAFLAHHSPYDWPMLSGEERQMVLDWKDILDSYNNGFIGPGHADDGSVVVDCIDSECPPCVIGMSFSGCAFDFNLWGSSYNEIFDADLIFLGEQMVPLASIPGYADTFEGIDDPYGHPFDCPEKYADAGMATSAVVCLEPNLSNFTPTMFMGASYNVNGLIPVEDEFGGSRVYEGNGIQFSANDCEEDEPPIFDPPMGSLKPVVLCWGGMIYDTIVARSSDPERIITISKISGPGNFTSTPSYSPAYGYYAYTPTTPGTYTVVFEAVDDLGARSVDSMVYEVSVNLPPEITATDTTIFQCWSWDEVCLYVEAFDPEGDPLTYTLLSGPGAIDPTTGQLCFLPDGEGEYPFEVEVADTCGADTAAFVVTVQLNNDPWINPFDTIVSLCELDTICFDVTAYDPDPDDSLEIILLDGPGEFIQTGNGVGRHCFLPDAVDSARYVFYYAVTDECWRDEASLALSPPVPPSDSIIVIVHTDVPPVITCPEELQGVFLCGPDSVCVDIPVEPPDALISIVEPGAVYDNGRLCFFAEASGQYAYTLVAEGECGSDTCFVVFDVTVDTPPMLTCPPSDSIHLCEPDYISVPLGVMPATARLTIIPEADYADGMLTFYADAEGDYSFMVYAETDCGIDSCSFTITVTLDSPPEVSISDSTVLLCELEEICIPFSYSDPDDNIARVVVQPISYKKTYDSLVCFTPPYEGEFEIIVTVLDTCGLYTSDTAMITVILNQGPSVEVGDEIFDICGPTDVCLPVTITDPDGNIDSVVVDEPAYYLPEKNAVCLPVTGPGTYDIAVTVYDDCGVMATDTGTAEVRDDIAPQITCPPTDAVHLCAPDSISIPLGVIPPSAIVDINPPADYKDGMLTFYAAEPGDYCFEVTAGNSCGSDSCNFCITVTIDSPPMVTIADSAVFQCDFEGICLPYSFYDADDNVVSVTVSSLKASLDISQTEGLVCFTPDRAGVNELLITVTDACGNTDIDTATVVVTLNQPPLASMENTSFYLCEPDVVCIPLYMEDPDGEIVRVEVMEPLYYDAENQRVCLPVDQVGLYQFAAVVYDDCGASALATAIGRVIINFTPEVIVPADTNVFQCDLSEVCLEGFEFIDVNQNLMSIEFTPDLGYYDNGRYCFTPDQAGDYCFVVRATDSCGAYDEDTVCVKVELGDDVVITCPELQMPFLCGPDSVCVDIPIVPVDAEVIVVEDGAVYENGKLCTYVEQSGVYNYTVIAIGDCGADTCQVAFDVTVDETPQIACPESQSIHLCEPDSIMIPIEYTPSTAYLDVGPNAVYEDGMLKFYPDTAGIYCFEVTASNDCGADVCNFCVTVTFDSPPLVVVGGGAFNLCQPEEICLPVDISDPDNNISGIVVEPDQFQLVDGSVCFTPDTAGTYVYTVTVTDSCEYVTADTGIVVVTLNQGPSVVVGDDTFFLCEPGEVCLSVEITDPEGAIDSIVVSEPAYYNPDNGTVCLVATEPGDYEITVTVYDDCGEMATDVGTATVDIGQGPVLTCPESQSIHLCEPDTIMLPLGVNPATAVLTIDPPAVYEDGMIKFVPDTAGVYCFTVMAENECGVDNCEFCITVTYDSAPVVIAPDSAIYLCEIQEVCIPVSISDPDGNIAEIIVTPDIFTLVDGEVCFTPQDEGAYNYYITVTDSCGNPGTDMGVIEITMNQGPEVVILPDSQFICEPAEICLPVLISDPDGSIDSIIVSDPWYLNGETVCRSVSESGLYEVTVTVYDDCGAMATDTDTATVTINSDPIVILPADTSIFLCDTQEVCFPVEYSDPDGNIADISLSPGFELVDGSACFTAYSAGQYELIATVTDSCGASDVDTMIINIDLNQPPMVAVGDTALFSCEPINICLPVTITDPEGAIESIIVSPPWVFDAENGVVCLFVSTTGNYEVMVTVIDTCGAESFDIGAANVTVNTAPQVIAPPDTSVFTCDISEVCLSGFDISDAEDNITTIEFIPHLGELIDGTYCFTPDTAGTYCFVVRATDACGAADEDTVCVLYELGQDVAITCPDSIQPISLCNPDSVCIDIPVDPATAEVVVLEPGAVYENGKLCFFAEGEGQYTYTLVATGDCASDTCQVTFDVSLMGGPMVTCPPDTAIHLCDPDSVSVPVGVIPASAEVVVSPEGVYADGMFTFFADSEGEYCFEVIATNECGSDTCNFCVTITIDSPPVVTIADTSLFLCNLEEICLPYAYSDPDNNVVLVEVSDKNRFTVTEGFVCFTPLGEGTEEIIITVTDSCGHSDVDTATVEITLNQDPFAYVGDTSVFICDDTEICVPVSASDADGFIDSIIAVEPAYYDEANGIVCLVARGSGNHEAIVMVYDDCGAVTVDTGIITVRYNFAPIVTTPADTSVLMCEPTAICLDGFSVIDIDGNLDTVMFIPDIGTWDDTLYCFTPQEPGQYSIIIHAVDTCGAVGQDTVYVNVTWGEYVSLDCPEGLLSESICDPDTICVDVPVTPVDAKVTVLGEGGYYNNGQLCFYADTTGKYTYTVIADGDCNSDTCEVTIDVTVGQIPVITCPEPGPVHLCGPDSVSIAIPITPSTAVVTVTPDASYSDGVLTFFAAKDGEYCFEVVAAGDCGADTCNFCVMVTFDSPPVVTVGDSTLFQCAFEEICVPVDYSDPDDNIDTVMVEPPGFSLVDGTVCFTPTAEGVYEVIVTVVDTCGLSASDTGTVNVSLNQGPIVSVADSTVFLCGTADICLDVTMSDSDGVIDSVVVTPPAYYDADNQRVCMSVDTDGTYEMIVTVYDDCGASATDTGTAIVTTNTGPTVSFGDFPNPMHLCNLSEVCLPITVYDAEDNIVSIIGSTTCGGEVVITEGQDFICWLPNTYGLCTVTVIVTDICGESDTAAVEIELIESPNPNPPCPNDTTVFACEIGQVCIDLGEVQPGSNITVRPSSYVYMEDTHQLCWIADGDASDVITVIDSTECGIDSCQFVLTTVMNRPPAISGTAPGDIEFCQYLNLCLEYTITDPDNNVESVRLETDCPDAVLDNANSRVCIEITTALDCVLNVIVEDDCGVADTLVLPIKAIPNQPPQIILPDVETVVRCEDDDSPIEISDICVTDPDYDDLTMVKDSGLGDFIFNDISHCGTLTFTPPTNDSAQYCFRFMATDECDTVYETYCLNVLPALVCSTCVDIRIEDPGCVNSGQVADIEFNATALNGIAAYDLLISYDATALNFLRADLGYDIDGWEYFTYRFGDLGNCEAPCPSGLIRLVAIADVNNGPFHPPQDQLRPDGNIASITFRVSSDLNLGGQNIPIEFFWVDCGDNAFSDPSGQYLYVDNIIYSPEGNIIWDESNDEDYPDEERPPHVGAPDSCIVGDKFEPVRCVSLHNGELCITHPDSVDARGDMNLNGIPYEIADVVVYTNYFIVGLNAFNINTAGQIAASDVNADGMTLSIADLVYLVRVIIGDADPYPKPIVGGSTVVGSCTQVGEEATVSIDSDHDIGAALLIFNCYGDLCGDPVLAEDVIGMEMKHGWLDGNLRILLYSLEAGGKIDAGTSDLIRIPVPEGSEVELVDMELADYYGRTLNAEFGSVVLPKKLELSQNYPNPFNPSTTFDLALPTASDYMVSIYNITGQVVRRWSGYAEAGYITFEWNGRDENGENVASGIYFYRAQAAGSEAIRKMILIK